MFFIHNTLSHLRSLIKHILAELNYNSSYAISFWIKVYNFKNSVEENTLKKLSIFVLSLHYIILHFPKFL